MTGAATARERREASIWTKLHALFAIAQLLVFVVSVALFVAYVGFHAVSFHVVYVSVAVKIALMVGAVITGSIWEHEVHGFWWFAPEFLIEDVMTLVVFITQLAYLGVVWLHPDRMPWVLGMLVAAYAIYLINVSQYIHKTQRAKQESRLAAESARVAALATIAPQPQPQPHAQGEREAAPLRIAV